MALLCMVSDGGRVRIEQTCGCAFPPERTGVHARPGRQLQPATAIAHKSVNGVGKGAWIVAGNQHTANAIRDGGNEAADRRSDNRGTARLCLDSDETEGLRMRRHNAHIRCSIPIGE